ncbi:glycoside hydrolase family 88 protein [Arthrobacter sp. M4]|uniref:glycoside hydrolase family 88 protein n=1 Tax=Arthrobacter sp. M4 TaxID=218160 RepID=UPI001CDC894A|nr:glycoside hydrolase family 88 protein [Arthrobacter sp. M4]MCA4133771.1 glycoside hydrolase family 88 protein [Arthrobacter sp. M4]
MSSLQFKNAQARMLSRIAATKESAVNGLPHWADPETGEWTLTPDGDWTGGAYVGELWLAHIIDPSSCSLEDVHHAMALMAPRIEMKTAFKGFGFYYGAAIGNILLKDPKARETALNAARSLADMFDERLGLIPLGPDAEEAAATGPAESSIDSLQASGLLFWAASELADQRLEEIAVRHTRRVLENHVRADGSVIQSSTLDPESGAVVRTHTHKGYSDTSVWGRAQAWAMIYSAQAAVVRPDEPLWREYARRTADWWIANAPADKVSFWDFDDPAIPDTNRDTAATAMATAALLRLSYALGDDASGSTYESFARESAEALIAGYLTPCRPGDQRPVGILTGGCFTRRGTVRSVDAATDVELIFGSYYLFEALAVLSGSVPAGLI